MKFTFRIAKLLIVSGNIPAWIPTVRGWGVVEPQAVLCWMLALVLMFAPIAYHHVWGLELA